MASPQVPFRELLHKSEDWVELAPDQPYKQVTVRLWGKGLALRGQIQGNNISASRQLRVHAGEFLISRIDARHGAFGLVPTDLEGAVVSNDFPSFRINSERLLPRYLEWFSKTSEFISLCRRASEGSTNRVRLQEQKFMEMMIPVPRLNEQQRIVQRLNAAEASIRERHHLIDEAKREMDALLYNVFKQIIENSPYRQLAKVAPLVRRRVHIDLAGEYPELGVRSFGRGTFHKPALPGIEVGNKKLYRIKDDDLLFNIVFAWEGAIAVAQKEDDGRVGSHRFLTCVPEPNVTTSKFLRYYLLTPEGLRKVGKASPGGAGRNRTLGLKKLEAIAVPIPPIEKQRWFDDLQSKVHSINRTRVETAKDADALISTMLQQIFGQT